MLLSFDNCGIFNIIGRRKAKRLAREARPVDTNYRIGIKSAKFNDSGILYAQAYNGKVYRYLCFAPQGYDEIVTKEGVINLLEWTGIR